MIFASENLENPDDLVDAVVNMTINDVGYELNTSTASDAQVKFARDPDTITCISNVINHQKLLSSRTTGVFHKDISVFLIPMDPKIGANNQTALLISTGVVKDVQIL